MEQGLALSGAVFFISVHEIMISPGKIVLLPGFRLFNRELPETIVLINGTRENGMIVEWAANAGGPRAVMVQDTTGSVMQEYKLGIEGLQQISVPPAGLVTRIAGK